MKYAVEMGPVAMINISVVKRCVRASKSCDRGDTQRDRQHGDRISLL
jgi:hypothetical protein